MSYVGGGGSVVVCVGCGWEGVGGRGRCSGGGCGEVIAWFHSEWPMWGRGGGSDGGPEDRGGVGGGWEGGGGGGMWGVMKWWSLVGKRGGEERNVGRRGTGEIE